MSGPKIVRVVTREEILAICNAHLQRLERAIASWDGTLRGLGVVDEAADAAVLNRFKELQALLTANKFIELQKAVPAEISFLEADEERQRIKAIETRAVAMRRSRQLKKNATVLLQSLTTRGIVVDDATTTHLKQVAAGTLTGGSAEALLGDVFRSMAVPVAPASLTESQRKIAARLVGENGGASFVKWQSAQADLLETRSGNLEKRMAELSTYLDDVAVKMFSDRLNTIDETEDEAKRNLRLDSLVLDVSAAVSQAKQDATLIKAGREVLAALHDVQGESASILMTLQRNLTDTLESGKISKLPALVEEGKVALVAATAKQAADARRAAVLAGLQALGYDVSEGMSTAWEQNGRVVLRKPSQPDYGVEISSAASGERMQVRAVAFSASRDLSRDSGVETSWCGDFGKLQSMLASQGGAIDIERSNSAGTLPLKAVDVGEAAVEFSVVPLVKGS